MDKINFSCEDCGQELAVLSEHVGRRVRCTACEHVQIVPSPGRRSSGRLDEPPPQSYRTAPSRESSAASSYSQPSDYDDSGYDDDYDRRGEQPTRSRRGVKKKAAFAGGTAGVIALIALAVVVIGGGVGVYLWLGGGVDDDLELVPSDAVMFVSGRPADLMDSHWVNEVRRKLPKDATRDMENGLDEMKKEIGLTIDEVERVTFFVSKFSFREPPKSMGVIALTKKSYREKDILDKFERRGEADRKKYKGKTYYRKSDKSALCFYSDKIILFGTEEGVKDSLRSKGDSGPLDAAKEEASRDNWHVSFAMNGKFFADLMKEAKKEAGAFPIALPGLAAQEQEMPDFDKIKYIGLFLRLDKDVTMQTHVSCESTSYAKEMHDKTQEQMKDVAKQRRQMEKAFAQMQQQRGMGPAEMEIFKEVMDAMFDLIKDMKVERDGTVVKSTLTIKEELIDNAIDWVEKQVRNQQRRFQDNRNNGFPQPRPRIDVGPPGGIAPPPFPPPGGNGNRDAPRRPARPPLGK